ncbi:MAG: hypothetical protein MHMPM18_004433 [Marteilia pararefringens]
MENSIAAEQEVDHLAEFQGEDSNSDTSQPELDLEESDSCSANPHMGNFSSCLLTLI